ncbi:MAG: sulfatase [Bacteroidetes bacterium]|nr:sulfatase [Bacteroidota bacterium]
MQKILIFLLLIVSCLSCSQSPLPNILWITIEDTSPQFIGYEGNEAVHTPNIDKLAREGVRFANAFATAPVCSSSRSTLITGCRTEALGTGNHRSAMPIPDAILGFPQYLRNLGYYTSNNSKTDYNTSAARRIIDSAWNESSGKAGWWKRESDQNFFSVFNYNSSHQSRTMTNPYLWYKEKVFNKLPDSLRTYPEEIEVPPFYLDSYEMRKHLVRVHNSLNLTDVEIGLLLDSLRQNGLIESTIIFFYADHGEGIPRGKTNPTGFGYKVPAFVWFPEKFKHLSPWPLGTVTDELISFEDLPPTVLSLAGAEIPDYMTGRTFIGKDRQEPRSLVYLSRNRIDESPDLARSVSNGKFLYTRVFLPRYPILKYQKYSDVSDITQLIRKDFDAGILNEVQADMLHPRPVEYLFDLHQDPWETNNLINDDAHSAIREDMRNELKASILEIRDIHFLPEYELKKISEVSTPYEYRLTEAYDYQAIIDAAYLSGVQSGSVSRILDLLDNENPVIRYWGAVGVHNQLDKYLKHIEEIQAHLTDSYPPVQIELAAVLFEMTAHPAAKDILVSFLNSDNGREVVQALQMIQYFDTGIDFFLPVIKTIRKKWDNKTVDANDRQNITNCSDVILHYTDSQYLMYERMAAWNEKEE